MAVLGLRFCARAFSSCGKRGPLFIAVRRPLTIKASLVAEHRLQTHRLSSCGSRAQLLRGMWELPRPGLEPVSPVLAGRFSTTAPPGKPYSFLYYPGLLLVSMWYRAYEHVCLFFLYSLNSCIRFIKIICSSKIWKNSSVKLSEFEVFSMKRLLNTMKIVIGLFQFYISLISQEKLFFLWNMSFWANVTNQLQ